MAGYDYASHQAPQPQPQEQVTCGDCYFYRDVCKKQESSGLTHYVGVCIFDIYHAETFEQLAKAEVVEADPADEPCIDYWGNG